MTTDFSGLAVCEELIAVRLTDLLVGAIHNHEQLADGTNHRKRITIALRLVTSHNTYSTAEQLQTVHGSAVANSGAYFADDR